MAFLWLGWELHIYSQTMFASIASRRGKGNAKGVGEGYFAYENGLVHIPHYRFSPADAFVEGKGTKVETVDTIRGVATVTSRI